MNNEDKWECYKTGAVYGVLNSRLTGIHCLRVTLTKRYLKVISRAIVPLTQTLKFQLLF